MGRLRMSLEQETPEDSWIGVIPKRCDLCGANLVGTFVDGKTITGHWVVMCDPCFTIHGTGLGRGRGQLYNTRGEKLKG